MKKILTIATAFMLAVSLTGCQEWLEATSSSQISGEKLFTSRAGFHEALSGVYLLMGSSSCYGMNYTWFVNELTAAPLARQNGNIYNDLQNNRYNTIHTTPYIESMWSGGYNVIANVNKILVELENHRDVVSDQTEYSLIRGELLAIRAYLHFDLMCMFGLPSWDGENASKLTIPYVTVYDKEPAVQRSYSETAALLMADIDEAVELLSVDPIRGNVSQEFNESINADGFWGKRTFHLNWYAVRALKARVLLQQKEYAAAAKLSREILDEVLEKEVVHWVDPVELINAVDSDYDSRDWTLSCEHIFTLEIPDYFDNLKSYFFGAENVHGNFLVLSQAVVSELYQMPYIFTEDEWVTSVGDIRGPALMLTYSSLGYRIYKYYSSGSSVYRNRQPMIRISELCFICAEAALWDNDLESAAEYINMVNAHRGMEDKLSPGNNPDLRNNPFYFLWKEYLKEFICEGRLFNYRKRIDKEMFYGGVSGGEGANELIFKSFNVLTYPYPVEETSYGHIQEL